MKYIKTYKLFESNEIEIREYLNDIFLELEDDGFKVEVDSRWIRTSDVEEHTGYEVSIKKIFTEFPIKTFLLEDIYQYYILTCKSYLKENGFFITDVEVSALGKYNKPEKYVLDYSISLHESNPEKYNLFDKPLINLEFKIRKNKLND
jgi:hypothetical protein